MIRKSLFEIGCVTYVQTIIFEAFEDVDIVHKRKTCALRGIRTPSLTLRTRLLYPLSYEGNYLKVL